MSGEQFQSSINLTSNADSFVLDRFDSRSITDLVPAGTTGSYQKLRVPGPVRLIQLSWSTVLPPGAGETVALRLYRVRPASNPAGFGYIQLNNTYTVSTATYTGLGDHIDISNFIRPNLCVLTDEYLVASWVHAGPFAMKPLNMNWNFAPAATNESEPPATTTNYADVFG